MFSIREYQEGEEKVFFEDYFNFMEIDEIAEILARRIGNSPSEKMELVDALEYYKLLKR